MSFIEVKNLSKEYQIAISGKGISGAVKSLFHREYKVKKAVWDISFSLEKGEIVGYIGPNGAGKSTTIKILSGVLIPTGGLVTVGGIIPYKDRKENARHIGVVFGQRSSFTGICLSPILLSFTKASTPFRKQNFRKTATILRNFLI